MKTQRTHQVRAVRWLSTLLLFGAMLTIVFPSSVLATGTPADTDINNMATINYDVGGTSIVVESSPTGNATTGAGGGTPTFFEVDQMVNLVVAEPTGGYEPGVAGSTTAVLTYTVANTGNDTFDFNLDGLDLSGVADPHGAGNDDLDGVTINGIYVDSDGPGPTGGGYVSGAHTYDSAADTATFIDDLPQDQMINVYMVCTIPNTATDGQVAVMMLRAEARRASDNADLTETSGADTTNAVDTVFADIDGDGAGANDTARNSEEVENDAFLIQAPSLTVAKTSQVIWDPWNNGANPKAIPNAYVRYTITITNNGAAAATLTSLSDVLQAEVTFEPDLRDATDTPENALGDGFGVVAPVGRGWGGSRYFSSANDADGLEYDGTNTVSANFALVLPAEAGYAVGELQPTEAVSIRFNVVVD